MNPASEPSNRKQQLILIFLNDRLFKWYSAEAELQKHKPESRNLLSDAPIWDYNNSGFISHMG